MKKILLVEDEHVLREIFSEGLRQAGYEVCSAYNGSKARQLFYNSCNPDLVILDIKLPDESGLTLLHDFRKNKSDIEVIIITAYELFQSEYEVWKADIAAYMVKPFDLEDLIIKVKEIIPLSATD